MAIAPEHLRAALAAAIIAEGEKPALARIQVCALTAAKVGAGWPATLASIALIASKLGVSAT